MPKWPRDLFKRLRQKLWGTKKKPSVQEIFPLFWRVAHVYRVCARLGDPKELFTYYRCTRQQTKNRRVAQQSRCMKLKVAMEEKLSRSLLGQRHLFSLLGLFISTYITKFYGWLNKLVAFDDLFFLHKRSGPGYRVFEEPKAWIHAFAGCRPWL